MKTQYIVTLLTLSTLLLAGCAEDARGPASFTAPTPTAAPIPVTMADRPEPTLSSFAPPTRTPIALSGTIAIPSTTTTSTSTTPGWTQYTSINQVYDLAFAPDGTLWAMTSGGLVGWNLRTDSYTRHLIPTHVADMAVAPDGTLWLATNSGVCRFDGATCAFYTEAEGLINNAVRAVAVALDGTVWVGTETGVSRYDGSAWRSYPAPVSTQDLAVAPNGEVWHATAVGVGRYLPSQDAWVTYTEEHGLPSSHAQVIATGSQGQVWTFILWHGVYRFDGERWEAVEEVPGGRVSDIAFAADGTPWIGTVGGMHYPGGSLVYREGDAWTDVTTARGLTSIGAVALGPEDVVAASTNLGLGIYQGGVWRLLRDGPTSDRATTVAVTPDGAAWFGFGDHSVSTPGGGLCRFDGEDWDYFLGDTEVNTLAVAPDGKLWAGVGCDVQRLDGATWETVARCEEDLPLGSVLDIAFTPDGVAWVANGFSLGRYDGGTWTVYDKLANSVVAATDGTIWINGWEGSQDSFYVARYDGESWTTYKTADAFPGALTVGAVTEDGRVWGVVPERGLASFSDSADTLAPHASAGGMDGGISWTDSQSWSFYPPPGGVSLFGLITVAPEGALWLRTENGVAHFDPAAHQTTGGESAPGEAWTIYTQDDGLVSQSSVIAFGPNNEIWFGTTRFQPPEPDSIRQSSSPPSVETPDSTTTPSRTVVPEDASSTPASAPQTTEVRWDTNPTASIIRYYSPHTTAGLAGAYDHNYYIPEVQVWGDGRIIWVVRERAARRVLEGRLTMEQMRALIQRIVDAGFFDWKDKYYTLGGYSFPPMYLSVNLIGLSKEVYEHGGAPDAYYELVQFLSSGAGCAGNDFLPTLGYLTAASEPIEANVAQWPDATAGITLDQVGDGLYVEGEALAFAWQAVNINPTAPVYVESNGRVYTLMIQIPGVSFFEPPPLTQP